jgi:hypothetical protein
VQLLRSTETTQNTTKTGCAKICSDIQIFVRDPEDMGLSIEDNLFVTTIQRKEIEGLRIDKNCCGLQVL